MKLVEILARELAEWPEGYRAIVQSSAQLTLPVESGRDIIFRGSQWDYVKASMDIYRAEFECSQLATDHATAIVTREMWQAERERIQAAEFAGLKFTDVSELTNTGPFTPTAGPVIDTDEFFPSGLIHLRTPITNRDRIREIDALFADLTKERSERVAELAAEGFALIDVVVVTDEDMEDWRNWRIGDVISVACGDKYVDAGLHVITDIECDDYRSSLPVEVKQGWPDINNVSWHSRP